MSKVAQTVIRKETNRLRWLMVVLLLFFIGGQAAIFYGVIAFSFGEEPGQWLTELAIATAMLFLFGVMAFILASVFGGRLRRRTEQALGHELHSLRAATNRAKSLQTMAATLSATLSFERVMEVALDVCSMALEELGISAKSLVGAVFLYDGPELVPVASRRFMARDYERRISDKGGIIGEAIKQAEATVTDKPSQDPELQNFAAFQNCHTAVCLPLRAGFQIFGAMVVATEAKVSFSDEHLELFESIRDQAVIALQNAQLYQRLESEKQRIIEADEDARRELARNLHDGPTQSVAAIAMRINFIRSLMPKDPRQAFIELKKVEDLAKQTSKEIRSMLFTLRPLVLETQGLGAAIETVMDKIRESDGLNLQLVGGEYGDLLSELAAGTVFYIIEEALGNARKYSQASLIEVRLWREGDLFVARVQDNGKGFDTVAVNTNYSSRGSLGMVNMRERAERIDGSLKLESAPGRGTAVTLVVPLEKHGRRLSE
jgi:signal transduction histidine kinase